MKSIKMADTFAMMESTGLSDEVLMPAFEVWASKRGDLQSLIKAGNLDPKNDFRRKDLRGWPLRGEDVRGIDFSYSDLRGTGVRDAVSDETTLFTQAIIDDDNRESTQHLSDWARFSEHMSAYKDAVLFGDRKLAQIHCRSALEIAMLRSSKDPQWEWGLIQSSFELLRLTIDLSDSSDSERLKSILSYQFHSLSQSALFDNRALSFFIRSASLLTESVKQFDISSIVTNPLSEVYNRVIDLTRNRDLSKVSSYNIFNISKVLMRFVYGLGDHVGSLDIAIRLINLFEFQRAPSQNFDTFDFWLRAAELACKVHRKAEPREDSLRYLRRAIRTRLTSEPFGGTEECGLRDLIAVGVYAAVSSGGEFEKEFQQILDRVDRVVERTDAISLLKRIRISLARQWKRPGIDRKPTWKIRLLISILRAELRIILATDARIADSSRFVFMSKFLKTHHNIQDIATASDQWVEYMEQTMRLISDKHYRHDAAEDERLFNRIIDEAGRLLILRTGSFL